MAAIFAGAAGAAALSLLLLILGTGLGLSAVSPWTMQGISATTFGFGAIIWLSFTQLAASGMGGYLAGRVRGRWTPVHTDEAYFRDTAHGFLTWAVASLFTVAMLTSVVGSIVSGGLNAGAAVAGGAANTAGSIAGAAGGSVAALTSEESGSSDAGDTLEYLVDSLFRSDAKGSPAEGERQSGDIAEIPVNEVVRIFARALPTGALPQDDSRYIGRLVAQRTELSQREAEERVTGAFQEVQATLTEAETMARVAAEEAHKASAYGSLWIFVTLLLGAFAASLMAVSGGRQRDS